MSDFDDSEVFPCDIEAPDEGDTVTITVDPSVRDVSVVDRCVTLLRPLNVYERAGTLMHVVRREHVEAGRVEHDVATGAVFAPTGAYHLTELLSVVARFQKPVKEGFRPCRCPEWLPNMIRERKQWPELRQARGLVEWPALVGDDVASESGYIEAQRIVSRIPEHLSVMARKALSEPMTQERARKACELLLEPFSDFPFADAKAKSALLALILTLVARNGYAGNTPLFVVRKNQKGSGGTMLVNAVSRMVVGRPVMMVQQPSADDGEEERKQMFSVLLSGAHLALIDNVTRRVGGKTIDSFTTATAATDRLLGGNETATLPTSTVWCVSGNNIEFYPDTTRRVIIIDLESKVASPSGRTDIRYPGPKLYEYIRQRRPVFLAAALGVLCGWIAAGRPRPSRMMGSFEGWAETVSGALEWAGLESPVPTEQELAADPEKQLLALLYSEWAHLGRSQRGPHSRISAAGLLRRVYGDAQDDSAFDALREAIEDLCNTPRQPGAKTLGHKLRHLSRQIFETKDGPTKLMRKDGGNVGALWGFDSPGVKW